MLFLDSFDDFLGSYLAAYTISDIEGFEIPLPAGYSAISRRSIIILVLQEKDSVYQGELAFDYIYSFYL